MNETAYDAPIRPGSELSHHYGDAVHVLSDPWALSLLARIGDPSTGTRDFHRLVRAAYGRLLHAASHELKTRRVEVPTRMATLVPGAAFAGTVVDPKQSIVIVDIARAGIVPADELQQQLLDLVDDGGVRVDHLYMQRVTNPAGRVVGVDMSGSKVGGPVQDATVFIPDPMGATGGSIHQCIDYYQRHVTGKARKYVVCHLMVTPEYVRRITAEHPDVAIYTLRVDRGLSADGVGSTELGATEDERGLTDTQYIVPGAGGLGELINNAFV